MNTFDKYLNETMNMLNERSINKIQAEFSEVVNKMSAMAKEFAAAEGDEKANILAELKGLTAKKNDLIKELDLAVAGKDKDVQLAITEAYGKSAGLTKDETMEVAQRFADAMSKTDGKKVTVNKRTLEEDSFDLDVDGEEFDGGSYNIYQNGNVMNMALPSNPVYGKKNDTVDAIAKNMKRMFESTVNEGVGTIALGVMLAWIGLKVLSSVAGQIIGKIGANVELPAEKLKQITEELVNRASKETKSAKMILLGTFLRIDIDKKIDSGEIKTISALEKAMEDYLTANESVVNEGRVTLKRQYTEKHPAITAGKNAAIRNKVLEAIKDSKISHEQFNTIVSELSNNAKRWAKSNSRYFTISEDGIMLSDFGKRIVSQILVNEKTTKNPEIWVPGQFDKEISKYPLNKITRELVLKAADKWDVDPGEAIPYVEFGWSIDLSENKNTNMKTKFIYESFSEFVSTLNEATITLDATDPKSKDLLKLLKKHKVSMKNLGEGPSGFDEVELSGDRKNLIAVISDSEYGWDDPELEEYIEESNGTYSLTVRSLNEAFASTKLASLLTGGKYMDKDLPKAFYNMSKISLDKIQDVDIIEMDPESAKKEKRNNAVYFYFTTNEKDNPFVGKNAYQIKTIPANTLLAITDGSNEWMATSWQRTYAGDRKSIRSLGTSKRDDSAGVDKSSASDTYGSGISSMKQVAVLADRAYVLDLDILGARYSTTNIRDERSAAKKGATAFMNDKEFKAANLKRYNEILSMKAAALPMDKLVADAIDTLSEQIKQGIIKGEQGRYGDLMIGTDPRGKEVKLSDASSLIRNILDDYSRYVNDAASNEKEKAAGYGGNYYEGSMIQHAKSITDSVKKIETMSYAW